jgi:uncharacterized protein YqgQ
MMSVERKYQRGRRRRNTASSSFDDVHRSFIHVVVVVYAFFLTGNDVVITTRRHRQQQHQSSSWNIVATTTATSILGVVTSSGVVYGNEEQPSYRRQHQQHRRRHPKPSRDPNPLPSIEDLEDQVRALMVSSRASRNDDTNDDLNIIDNLLDDIVGTHSGLIVDKFIPTRIWLYFSSGGGGGGGGIFAHILPVAYWNMIISLGVCLLLRQITHNDWKVWKLPLTTSTRELFQETTTSRLSNFNTVAIQILDITHELFKVVQVFATFVLILFVQQSYTFWYSIYNTSRNIQSTMSDIQMILSSQVTRRRNNGSYTPGGERYLNDVAQLLRAYHVLFWCSQTRHYRILLTDYGLSRMVSKNVLTQNQKLTLDKHLTIPKTQKHWIVLQWILAKCTQQQEIGQEEQRKRRMAGLGRRRKAVLHGGAGLEQVVLEKICALRNYCKQIQTKTVARMPLPYLHFIRVVVDVFLLMTTFALYNTMGMFAAITTGIISVCYLGLLDLSFAFLDPFDDEEEFRDASMNLDLSVLLRESTATSQRWINAASKIHNIK